MGMSLGQLEINHKFISYLLNQEEPISKSNLKKAAQQFTPMTKFDNIVESSKAFDLEFTLSTPKEFYEKLSEVVIGQEIAKKAISVSVINHMNAIADECDDLSTASDKHHVLMLGHSGTGKTLIANTTASLLNLPFVSGDATGYSPTGFHGADVESVCYDLLLDTDMNFDLAERGIVFIDEIDKICSSNRSSGRYESFIGSTQTTFLKLIEGKMIKVPGPVYGDAPGTSCNISSEKMLFFFGGAFNGLSEIIAKKMGKKDILGFVKSSKDKNEIIDEALKSYEIFAQASREELVESLIDFGMLSEFVGRIPTIVPLKPLSKEDLEKVLLESKTSPIFKQIKIFENCGYKLEFTDSFIKNIVSKSYKSATGTRALDSYVKKAVSLASFDLLSIKKSKHCKEQIVIDENCLSNPELYSKSFLG
jgi:ATP-dependent Clp protease ATP-binding subunit ClpX